MKNSCDYEGLEAAVKALAFYRAYPHLEHVYADRIKKENERMAICLQRLGGLASVW